MRIIAILSATCLGILARRLVAATCSAAVSRAVVKLVDRGHRLFDDKKVRTTRCELFVRSWRAPRLRPAVVCLARRAELPCLALPFLTVG